MMVRFKQVSESQASGTTGRAAARCWWRGIERFLVRNEWRNETGVGGTRGDRWPSVTTNRGRRAGCHEDFIGFHRAFRTVLSSPVRIFKPVKNLLDRGFPFRTLNGIDVWGDGKTGARAGPVRQRGHPAVRAPPGDTEGGENEQPGGCHARPVRRAGHVTLRSVPSSAGRRRSHRRASAAPSATGARRSASHIRHRTCRARNTCGRRGRTARSPRVS